MIVKLQVQHQQHAFFATLLNRVTFFDSNKEIQSSPKNNPDAFKANSMYRDNPYEAVIYQLGITLNSDG